MSNSQIESITYAYDSLNRLSVANGGSWRADYGYDGFGNLQTVAPTGAGPSAMNVTVNPATNRLNGWTYDANGNVTVQSGFTGTYDVENRLLEASKNSTMLYGYGADNRRIWESKRTQVFSNGDTIEEYLTYWSGQRIGKYKIRWNGTINSGPPDSFVFARVEENVYFGSKPLRLGTETNIAADRLGSIRRSTGKDYFPYGQENPTTTAGDKEKYGTYKHDAATDLSYADQRYYATGAGRFMTADPYKASAGSGEPESWNRYAYVESDPINFADPKGLQKVCPETFCVDVTDLPPLPPLPALPQLPPTGPGYIPALPPGPIGPGPYSAPTWMGFNQADGNTIRSATAMANQWVKNKNCDQALKKDFGVNSLGDAMDKVQLSGERQNVWNGRKLSIANSLVGERRGPLWFDGPVFLQTCDFRGRGRPVIVTIWPTHVPRSSVFQSVQRWR